MTCLEENVSWEQLKAEGNVSFKKGHFDVAKQYYSKALDIAQRVPEKCVLLANRAQCSLKLQAFEDAAQDCHMALQHQKLTDEAPMDATLHQKLLTRRSLAHLGMGLISGAASDAVDLFRLDCAPAKPLVDGLYESSFGPAELKDSRVFSVQPALSSSKSGLPPNCWKAASAVLNGKAYVFGGQVLGSSIPNPLSLRNSLHEYDPYDNSWDEVVLVDHTKPPPRAAAIMEGISNINVLILWSGYLPFFLDDSEVFVLNMAGAQKDKGWKRERPQGVCPPKRHSAASALHGSTLFIFGGEPMSGKTYLGDLWALNTQSMRWVQFKQRGGPLPTPRHSAKMCSCGGALWVFGGNAHDPDFASSGARHDIVSTNIMERFDLGTLQWSRIPLMGDVPGIRAEHALAKVTLPGISSVCAEETLNEYLIIFGGFEEQEKVSPTILPELGDLIRNPNLCPAWTEAEEFSHGLNPYRRELYLFDPRSCTFSRWRSSSGWHELPLLAEAFVLQRLDGAVLIGGGYGIVNQPETATKQDRREHQKRLRQYSRYNEFFDSILPPRNDVQLLQEDGEPCIGPATNPERNYTCFTLLFCNRVRDIKKLECGPCDRGTCPDMWTTPRAQFVRPACAQQAAGQCLTMCECARSEAHKDTEGIASSQSSACLSTDILWQPFFKGPLVNVCIVLGVLVDHKQNSMESCPVTLNAQGRVRKHEPMAKLIPDTYRGPVLESWLIEWACFIRRTDSTICIFNVQADSKACKYQDVGGNSEAEMDVLRRFLAVKEQQLLQEQHAWRLLCQQKTDRKEKAWLHLRVELADVQPRVWRTITVPADMKLAALHDKVLCAVMPWTRNYHAYCFRVKKVGLSGQAQGSLSGAEMVFHFGPVDSTANDIWWAPFCYGNGLLSDSRVRVRDVLSDLGDEIEYIYDLGDHWRHVIQLEQIVFAPPFATEAGGLNVVLHDGWGSCPPEDVGGPKEYIRRLWQLWPPAHTKNLPIIHGESHMLVFRKLYPDFFPPDDIPQQFLPRSGIIRSSNERWQIYNELRGRRNTSVDFDPCVFDRAAMERRLTGALRSSQSLSSRAELNLMTDGCAARSYKGAINEDKSNKSCAVCESSVALMHCSCRLVWYCCAAHQQAHWAEHKRTCVFKSRSRK